MIDSEDLKEVGSIDAHAQEGTNALTCALSPSSTQLATTGGNGTVLLFDLRALGHGPMSRLRGHSCPVHAASFSRAGALAQHEVRLAPRTRAGRSGPAACLLSGAPFLVCGRCSSPEEQTRRCGSPTAAPARGSASCAPRAPCFA